MSKPKRPIVAICYDFDGTLSPGNMQEYNFFPGLGVKPRDFWREAGNRAKEHKGDHILSYMTLMIEKARAESNKVKIDRKSFERHGEGVDLFDGVDKWFGRISKFARKQNVKIEHYIVSSGLREMISGTKIARHFKKIYASAFMYDKHGVASWPILALNYTTKTQFLFRINKGISDEWDDKKINDYTPEWKRRIPFERMIYIGDGETDVPCMKLVKDQGGYSIAVYQPHSSKKKARARKLLKQDRVNFVAPADYLSRTPVDLQVKNVIRKIAAKAEVDNLQRKHGC
ncbi:MAG TPA: HAD family hydrolase [Candidatus Omnitrophota bacterium]|nr:HAD family hydrolase [Candidatus Omnitrophota bacterium]HPD85596.1 HAD family hydrolase [Candidatus Omnitrophota bacterium]HRZ04524.1 HAD family hydrolase [Candidatus Omnitrophota bacterium]